MYRYLAILRRHVRFQSKALICKLTLQQSHQKTCRYIFGSRRCSTAFAKTSMFPPEFIPGRQISRKMPLQHYSACALELQQCNHIGGASNSEEKESNNKCSHEILTGHIGALETQVIDFKNIEATQTRWRAFITPPMGPQPHLANRPLVPRPASCRQSRHILFST